MIEAASSTCIAASRFTLCVTCDPAATATFSGERRRRATGTSGQRMYVRVGVADQHQLGLGHPKTDVLPFGLPTVQLIANDAHARVARHRLLGDSGGVVGRASVEHQYQQLRVVELARRGDTGRDCLQRAFVKLTEHGPVGERIELGRGPACTRLSKTRTVLRIASCSRVFAVELDQTFPDAGGVFKGVSQRCLKLSSEVEAFIRGDEVGGAQVEVVVEPVPQIEQDRLEIGDQLSVRYLRDPLLVHGGCRRVNSNSGWGPVMS
jgi:hypothetical protein